MTACAAQKRGKNGHLHCLQMGRKKYHHEAIIAQINEMILGWDFFTKKKISLVWKGDDLVLEDKQSNIITPTKNYEVSTDILEFHTISTINEETGQIFKSYQQYSQKQSARGGNLQKGESQSRENRVSCRNPRSFNFWEKTLMWGARF